MSNSVKMKGEIVRETFVTHLCLGDSLLLEMLWEQRPAMVQSSFRMRQVSRLMLATSYCLQRQVKAIR